MAHNFGVCETLLHLIESEKTPKIKTELIVDVFPIQSLFLRLINYDWQLLRSYDFEVLEDLVVSHVRLFNEVATTMRTLEMNPHERDTFAKYLVVLLKQCKSMKNRFDQHWSSLSKGIDTIKIVKSAKPRNKK